MSSPLRQKEGEPGDAAVHKKARVEKDKRSVHWPCDLRDVDNDKLAQKNELVSTQGLVLTFHEDEHIYVDEKGMQSHTSVTSFIANDASLFLAGKIALSMSRGDKSAAAALIRKWEATADKGTKVHAYAETLMNNPGIETIDPDIQVEAAQVRAYASEYLGARNMHPYRTECVIGYRFGEEDQYLLAGSVDLVVRDATTGKFGIHDFKCTDKDLLHPKNSEKLATYSLQLTCYAHMLQHAYGLDIDYDNLVLVVVHETREQFQCIPILQSRKEWRPEVQRVVDRPLREVISSWFNRFDDVLARLIERKLAIEEDNKVKKDLLSYLK